MTKITEAFLKKLANKAKLDLKVVEELCEKAKEEYKHLKGEEFENAVIYALSTSLKAHKRSSAIQSEGMLLGFTQPFDYNFKFIPKENSFWIYLRNMM